MTDKLFVDTWGWLTIHNKREPKHTEVNALYKKYRSQGGTIYTTDYVLDETLTLLFRRLSFSLATECMLFLDDAILKGYLILKWTSPEIFEEAKSLRLKFKDKPKISFTDLTSMAVMKELGITSILTDDDHFTHVGMKFEKIPSPLLGAGR